ncbi:MAG: D-alanyl-D-alanine dipeptidase, partial [Saprospiraceae bacterium]
FIYLSFLLCFVNACTDSKVNQQHPVEITKDSTLPKMADTIITGWEISPIDYDSSQWTELIRLDKTIVLDMRYATTNNFVNEQLYDCARCFLRPEAAEAVMAANQKLKAQGYRLKMYDCFRPLPIQQRLWDKFRNPSYVTPPSKGSMHNRGLAVDLTIVDANGTELDMGTEFDFFGKEAHHTYTGHSETVNKNRLLLKETLESLGFKGIRTEWWHYSYVGKTYDLSEMVWECEGS